MSSSGDSGAAGSNGETVNADLPKFSCPARFVGRKMVQGPLNDIGLSLLVTDLQTEANRKGKMEVSGGSQQVGNGDEFR